MLTYINRKAAAGIWACWTCAVWSELGRRGRGGQGWGQASGGEELVPASLVSRGNAPALQAHAQSQGGGFTGNPVWWIQPAHRLPCKRGIASEEGAIWPLILWQARKERGPKNEEEEEEIGDGQSTASVTLSCKMSHLLAITAVAYEECSEKVAQVPTLHWQIRLRAVLETAGSTYHHALLFAMLSKLIQLPLYSHPPTPLPVVFGNFRRVLTLHFALSQGLYCLGQLAAINVHIGVIISSLHSFLTVFYPMEKQYWVRLCNSQP